jgi:hypothetical protein
VSAKWESRRDPLVIGWAVMILIAVDGGRAVAT